MLNQKALFKFGNVDFIVFQLVVSNVRAARVILPRCIHRACLSFRLVRSWSQQ
jgi:hypothetical protein